MAIYIEIDFIHVNQPIGSFYIGSMDWQDLLRICSADIRKIHKEDRNKDSFDSYLGIQRTISEKRITDISNYVDTIDATFPTSIILHMQSTSKFLNDKNIADLPDEEVEMHLDQIIEIKNIEVNVETNKLRIRSDEKIAKILDGQHRIEGLRAGFENKANPPKFQFNITIFVDLDMDDQAQIFSVINKAQTKVNKSLVYDLYDYARFRSPQKTAHDIVRLLNRMPDSPFYKKIKILGTAENKEIETIAQATFVELIMGYISRNPMQDRDTLRRKKIFGKTSLDVLTTQIEIQKLFFRNFFINEKDDIILNILWNYFYVIQQKWSNAWSNNIEGNILNKSTGIISFMRFLKFVIRKINIYDAPITVEKFKEIFDQIDMADHDFNKNKYIPGSTGQAWLLRDLKQFIGAD